MKVSKLKPNPDNPRHVDPDKLEKLKTSITNFPEMMTLRPLVIDDTFTVLGGNQRLAAITALGMKEIPDEWVVKAGNLTPEQKREFIVKDNVAIGEWDWQLLATEWETDLLEDWGLDLPGFDLDAEQLGDEFALKDGDKSPFQGMSFTFADEQATVIKNALEDMKKTDEFKYAETFGNENSNGNALYLIVSQWASVKQTS